MLKKVLCYVCAMLMVVSCMPISAFAETDSGITSGTTVVGTNETNIGGNAGAAQNMAGSGDAPSTTSEPSILAGPAPETTTGGEVKTPAPEGKSEVAGVAKIGETSYETLKAAIDAANAADGGATVTLLADVTLSEKLTIKNNITISGGKMITRGIAGTIFAVDKNATLTLDGGVVIDGGNDWTFDSVNFYAHLANFATAGTWNNNGYATPEEGGIVATAAMISVSATDGAVVMNQATIQNSVGKGIFSVPAGATVTMNNGALIRHCNATEGAVFGQMSGKATINSGAKVTDLYCFSPNGGLADVRNSGVLTIDGGEICFVHVQGDNNDGSGSLAQVYGVNAKLVVNVGSCIHDMYNFCPAGGWGSIVYLNRGGNFVMNGGTIVNGNSDKSTTIGVNDPSSTVALNAGTIDVNESVANTYDSLLIGNIIIGEDMTINGGDVRFCGTADNTIVINGTVNSNILLRAENITNNGVVNGNVTITKDSWVGNDGSVTISGGTWNGTFTVEEGASLSITGGTFKNDSIKQYVAEGKTVTINGVPYTAPAKKSVATKAELKAAIEAAKDGDIIVMTADIDYGTDHIELTKAITLDLGGKMLTTRARNYGLALKNENLIVTNGKLNHAGTVAAIKVWNAKEISNLEIDVTGTSSSGNAIGGIVIQENAAGVKAIKNVKIYSTAGQGIANGIETNNCGNATSPVIGSMENVSIDAVGNALNISAPCGTATGCTFKGGVSGIEIWIKGTYSATLDLKDCDVHGGTQAVYAHDEFSSNPAIVNSGSLELVTDEKTTFNSTVPLALTVARINESTQLTMPEKLIEAFVAKVNGNYYDSFTAAVAEAPADSTITLLKNITLDAVVVIDKTITLALNGNTVAGSFELTLGGALTAPEVLTVATRVAGSTVIYENGTYLVAAKEYVARIGDAPYETLKDAIAAANAIDGGATVTLLKDITLSEKLTIKKNITITGAHTITRGIADTIFAVDKNATLILDGGVIIDGGNNWIFDGANFYADMMAGKTLSTGAKNSYSASAEGGLVSTGAMISISGTKGELVMNQATIQNVWGSQLFSIPAGATLTMGDGALISHIRGSVAGQMSGAWVMAGGKITDVHNHNTNGGLVDMRNSSRFTINGGEICYVTVLGLNANGNGILAQVYGNSAKLTVNGGNIHDNASFSPGGGWGSVVYLNRGGDFEMNGGTITTTASDHCTAFVSNTSTSIVLNNGTINVEKSTSASFDSLIYGNVTIGEGMKIAGDGLAVLLGDPGNTFENNGTIDTDVQICYAEVTGNGTCNGDVIVKADAYFEFDGKTVISGGTWNGTFTVEDGASLTITGGTFKNDPTPYLSADCKVTKLADGTYGVEALTVYKVATKAELDAALAAAQAGEKILLTADIDYGTTQLKIEKAITLDLGGKTLTNSFGYGGLSLKGNCSVKNGTIDFKGTVAAIKAWEVASLEDLVINVAYKEGKTIGGIVIQENAAGIGTIKNVTIKGDGLTNGIETYNCGNATAPVIGFMENVTIDAVGTGMLLSAPVGTATGCTIKGDVSGIDMLLKGTYSVSLTLVDCDVTGGQQAVYAHDEQKGYTYVGTLSLTADEATTFASESGVLLTELTENSTSVTLPAALVDGAVAKVNGAYYKDFAAAVKAANEAGTATVTLLKGITLGDKLTITGDVTISGAYTITRDAAYTGTLFAVNAGAALTLDGGLVIDGNNKWTLNTELYNKALNREVTGVTWAQLITSEEGKPNATAPMFLVNGSVVANNVTIQNNYSTQGSNNGDYGVFKVEANATLTMTGATVKHIVTGGANSVAHLSTNAVWTINDGTLISDTFAGKNGGVCRNDSGLLVMNGGEISHNNSINTNGTVVMLYKGSMEMKGGMICSNTGISGSANGRCAPIYGHSTSTFIMTGGEICHNTGISYGGVDVPSSIKVEISGGYIGENISSVGNTNKDVNGNANTVITGGTFTQDVSAWLAPNTGLVYNETTGIYGLTKDLFEYNGQAYKSLAEVIAAIKAAPALLSNEAPTVKVLASHKIDEPIVIDVNMTLNLNVNTITGAAKDGQQVYPVIRVQNGASVTVKGGTITNADYVFVLGASDGSTAGNLTIESGTFVGQTTVASVTKGTLTINGGTFSITETEPYDYAYLLNCVDANYKDGSAKIVVKGGTFYKFNPANNAAEGAGTNFCAEGYTAVETATDTWTVRMVNFVAQVGETKYGSLKEAIDACKNGETVKLIADITYGADDVVFAHGGATGFGNYDQYNPCIVYVGGTKGATAAENQPSNVNAVIDLNGHTITSNADAYMFIFMDNCKVTIEDSVGGGAIINNSANYPAIWAVGTETLVTIKGGKYQTASPYGVIHATHSGDLVIEGGHFSTTAADASLLLMINSQPYNNPNYFLKGVATLTVKGGTFVDFNPAEIGDDYGASSIEDIKKVDGCAEGFAPKANDDGTYTVKPLITVTFKDVTMANGNALPEFTYTVNYGSVTEADAALTVGKPSITLNGVGEYEITAAASVSDKYVVEVIPGKLTVVEAVAEMVGKYYASVNDALEAVPKRGTATIKVLADHEIDTNDNTYEYPILINGRHITLDLNGKTLTADWSKYTGKINGGLISMLNGGTLNVIGNGTIKSLTDNNPKSYHALFYVQTGTTEQEARVTIENGTFVQTESQHLIYIEGNKPNSGNKPIYVNIKGGTFIYEGSEPGWFNAYDGREQTTTLYGGTYNVNPIRSELKLAEGYVVVENNDGTWTVREADNVAQIGEAEYKTLAAAIAAVKNGETITLLKDIDETVTIKQTEGLSFTIDGDGKTYSGTINIDGNGRPNGAETLTIKNVNFKNTTATTYAYFINAEKNATGGNSQVHNLTVDNCTFESTNWHYAIVTRHPNNLVVKNCTANKVYYFIYNPQGGEKMTVENCTVTGATYGIGAQKCKEVYIKDYTYTGKAAGFYGRSTSNECVATLENVNITTTLSGQSAMTLWKNDDNTTSKTYTFIFKGQNTLVSPDGVASFSCQSETNSPYALKLADVNGTLKASADLDVIPGIADCEVVYENDTYKLVAKNYVAQVGETKYEKLTDAIAAAKEANTTVTVLKTIELTEDGTLDLQGVRLNASADIQNAPVFRVLANITVTNGIVDGGSGINCYAFIVGNSETAGELTITSGTYRGVTSAISITNGVCNIKGGTFQTKHDDEGTDYGTTYLLNCMDAAYKNGTAKFNITGGKFVGFNPENNAAEGANTNFLSGNYKASDYYGDNKWYVAEANVLVGADKYFTTIYDALDFIQPRETADIKLLSDITITADQRMFSNYSIVINAEYITLDLNGKTITFDYTGSTSTCYASIAIYNKGTLTIIDSSAEQTGTIYNKTKIQGTDGPRILWITSAGSATLEGGHYISEQGDTMFYASNSNMEIPTTLYIKGGYYEHTVTTNGGKYRYFNIQDGGGQEIIEVNGGVFAHDFRDGEMTIGEGFAAQQLSDGTWGVVKAVATVIKENGNRRGNWSYATLAEAVAAAKDGDTVQLLGDVKLTDADMTKIDGTYGVMIDVTGKSITLDMNGKRIDVDYDGGKYLYAVVFVADGANLTVTGDGTIDISENGANVAYMFWKRGTTGALTIKNGTYHMNDAEDSMIYTNGDRIVTVEGGTFTLDAVGTRQNGFPCIFNATGQNEKKIVVTGGTYNCDIGNELFWCHELEIPATHSVKNNGNDTWTVVEGAVASITEKRHDFDYTVNYASLADAVAAAKDGNTIVLLKDITISQITIGHTTAVKVTIDLGGHTITSTDVAITAFRSGTEVTLTNGTIKGNSTGGTIKATYAGKLILGDNITVISGGQANAVNLDTGSLIVESGKNVVVSGGIGCLNTQGTSVNKITIASGTYTGAIKINGDSTCVLTGGTFTQDVNAYCAEGYYARKNSDGTWTVVKQFEVDKTNMRFGSNLSILFAFAKSNVSGSDYYAVITRKSTDGSVKVPYEEWKNATISGVEYWAIEYKGIAAKEMGDDVTIQIYTTNGLAVSTINTTSISKYAMASLKTTNDAKYKTLLVDLLNYGAEAQKYFHYDVEHLVNASLTEEQQKFATNEKPKCTNKRSSSGTLYVATNARFANTTTLLFMIKKDASIEKAKFTYFSYKDSQKPVEVEISVNDFKNATYNGKINYVVEFSGLVFADARQVVTCEIYDKDGQVITTIQDSLESYVARQTADLYYAFMKAADSALAYMN